MNSMKYIFHAVLPVFLSLIIFSVSSARDKPKNCLLNLNPRSADTVSAPVFLDKNEAARAILADSLDPYFERLQPMEIRVKCGREIKGDDLDEIRERCRQHYSSNVMDFTLDEINALLHYIKSIDPVLKGFYPAFTSHTWAFIKVNSTVEGGLPHTRDRYIILSEDFLSELTRAVNAGDVDAFYYFVNVLIHEKVHTYQRLHKEAFGELYRKQWKFRKISGLDYRGFLTEHQLLNPDGTEAVWAYPVNMPDGIAYIIPHIILSEGEGVKKMPEDFRKIALPVITETENEFKIKKDPSGKPVYFDLSEAKEYIDSFPKTDNNYHPHELSADIFARIATMDILENTYTLDSEISEEFSAIFSSYRNNFLQVFR